jgi:hypothetical protein
VSISDVSPSGLVKGVPAYNKKKADDFSSAFGRVSVSTKPNIVCPKAVRLLDSRRIRNLADPEIFP